MEVLKINKKIKYYQVYFTDGSIYKLKEDILIKYQLLKPKSVIADDLFLELLHDNDFYLALDDSYKYLERISSKQDLKNHLRKKYELDIVDRVIVELESKGLIDDRAYALEYIPYGLRMGYGKNKIRAKLQEKGISDTYIEEAISSIDEKEYLANFDHELEKFIRSLKPGNSQSVKRKTIAHMVSMGYGEDLALSSIEKKAFLLDNIIRDDLFIEKDYNNIRKKLDKKNLDKNTYKEKLTASLMAKGYTYSDIKKLLEKGFS